MMSRECLKSKRAIFRDDYITINWDNIMSGMEYNFLKYDMTKISHLGSSYDTCSVMHYGAYAFSKVTNNSFYIVKQLLQLLYMYVYIIST
jgi:hypothetical protein